MSIDTQVILLGLLNVLFNTAGIFFQKLNGARGGNMLFSIWVVAATLCFMPTFFLGNRVYLMGGRMSVFVPISALTYVLTTALGKLVFKEDVSGVQIAGCILLLCGVALIART